MLREFDEASGPLSSSGRAIEALKQGLPEPIERLADFLGLPLTPAKRDAVVAAVGFDTMKATSPWSANLRQGTTGDWKNHMDGGAWVKFDEVFDARMEGVTIAERLRNFQAWDVISMPPRGEQTLQTDPCHALGGDAGSGRVDDCGTEERHDTCLVRL